MRQFLPHRRLEMKLTAQKFHIHPDSIQIFGQRDSGPECRAKFAFRTDPEGAFTAIVPISDDRLTSAAAVPRAAIYAWCGSSRPSGARRTASAS